MWTSLWMQLISRCHYRAKFQFYSESRLKTPYNFPLFGCFFQLPWVKNSLYYFHSGFELTTAVKVPYVSHLEAVFFFLLPLNFKLNFFFFFEVQLCARCTKNTQCYCRSRGSLNNLHSSRGLEIKKHTDGICFWTRYLDLKKNCTNGMEVHSRNVAARPNAAFEKHKRLHWRGLVPVTNGERKKYNWGSPVWVTVLWLWNTAEHRLFSRPPIIA